MPPMTPQLSPFAQPDAIVEQLARNRHLRDRLRDLIARSRATIEQSTDLHASVRILVASFDWKAVRDRPQQLFQQGKRKSGRRSHALARVGVRRSPEVPDPLRTAKSSENDWASRCRWMNLEGGSLTRVWARRATVF